MGKRKKRKSGDGKEEMVRGNGKEEIGSVSRSVTSVCWQFKKVT